jgi:Co/Zn/Cd efflux system component
VVPEADVMRIVGAIALVANVFCLALLWRRRADDVNMRSAWICSRNDVVANVGVLLAAATVRATSSGWPDIIVGLAIAAMFMESSVRIIRDATQALRV